MIPYTDPPPVYASDTFKPNHLASEDATARDPLLGPTPSSDGGAFYDQPRQDNLPDDFRYGVTVFGCSTEIRNAFVHKLYTILFCQILASCIVGGSISQSSSTIFWVQTHAWTILILLFGSFVNLILLHWKCHSHPLNLLLLSTFTLTEAVTIGFVIAFYDNMIVMQTLLISLGVFLGLTLFTLQSKYDFSGMGPFLLGILLAVTTTGLVKTFIPFNKTIDLVYAIGTTLLFSGYVVYDTHIINARLSPDQFVLGAISLYLDLINLFVGILRILKR